MLDPSGNKEVKQELDECKEKITANLQRNVDVHTSTEAELEQLVGPPEMYVATDIILDLRYKTSHRIFGSNSVRQALDALDNPRKALLQIYQTMGHLISQLEEMLGCMGSGDESRMEGGEGLKGDSKDDFALSMVKLYKGETLLELTERWKFSKSVFAQMNRPTHHISPSLQPAVRPRH